MTGDDRTLEAFLETVAVRSDTGALDLEASIEPDVSEPDRVLALLAELGDVELRAGIEGQLEMAELIGRGGMGQVHLATQRSLGRRVAVKTVRPDRRDPTTLARLVREAWVTGSLEHPNVVPVHSVGIARSGDPMVVLKRIEGVEWSQLIGQPDDVAARYGASDILEWNLSILLQVANAVRFAHSRGVVHRDLKPHNVMIGEFGEVYLVDWGIALSTRSDPSRRLPLASEVCETAGTPGYMAPEMLAGGPITTQTDIYLLGAILFEVIEGRMPHQAASHTDVVDSIQRSVPELGPSWPAELRAICTRAMAREPSERFGDVAELQAAIRQFLEHRSAQRLLDRATERLNELEQRAAELRLAPAPATTDLAELWSLLSECRFGFREAQSSWPDNVDAAAGLDRALRAMIEVELHCDEPRSARNLAAELSQPDPELASRIDAALVQQQARLAKLDALGQQLDPNIGRATRNFTVAVLGLLWCATPLVIDRLGADWVPSPGRMAFGSAVMLIFIAGFGYWARDSLSKTYINRRLIATALFVPPSQLALIAGCALLDLSTPQLLSLLLFLWFVLAAMIALSTTLQLLPMTAGYLAAFMLSPSMPDRVFLLMAAANLLMLLNVSYCSARAKASFDEPLAVGAPANSRGSLEKQLDTGETEGGQ